jgi:hypothetical protein
MKLYKPMFWFPDDQPPLGWVEVVPDYEAATELIQKDRKPMHGCSPACAKCKGYARRYVDAALQEGER